MKRSLLSFYIGFTEHPEPVISSYVVQLPQTASQMASLFTTPKSVYFSKFCDVTLAHVIVPSSSKPLTNTQGVLHDVKIQVTSGVYEQVPDEYKHLLEICDKPFPL